MTPVSRGPERRNAGYEVTDRGRAPTEGEAGLARPAGGGGRADTETNQLHPQMVFVRPRVS